MPTYRSGQLDLAYRSVGHGPALVLLHGWGADGREWDHAGWVEALGSDRRLLIPDLRGHGQSAKPHDPGQHRAEALVTDVLALLASTGDVEVDVFGYSLGAAVALWFAVSAPARVRSLVVGGAPEAPNAERMLIADVLRGASPSNERAARYREYVIGYDPGCDLVALAAAMEAGVAAPPCAELAVYGGEALLVAGASDRRRAGAERLAGCLPGGRFVPLDGADHMAAFSDARFREAVRRFLAEVSPT